MEMDKSNTVIFENKHQTIEAGGKKKKEYKAWWLEHLAAKFHLQIMELLSSAYIPQEG